MHTLARVTVSSPEEAGEMREGSIMLLRSSFSSREEIRRCLLRRPASIFFSFSNHRLSPPAVTASVGHTAKVVSYAVSL